MRVLLGYDSYLARTQRQRVPVEWDSRAAINGHLLMVGGSGCGKTHTLKRFIRGLVDTSGPQLRIHVFDVHGDIELPGSSSVLFSEATPYGYNPLIINPDRHSGGVRRRIQGVIAALNQTSRQLGNRQEAVLRALLIDLYAANGFYEDKPASWSLDDGVARRYPKKHPTLQDAARFAAGKLKRLYSGADSEAVAALEEVHKKARAIQAKLRAQGQHRPAETGDSADLSRLKGAAIEAYTRAVQRIETGRELDDLMRYDSKEVLRSLCERLDNLNALGIFRPEPPPFDPKARIHRYDLKALAQDEKKLFVQFRLSDLFQQATQRGLQQDLVEVAVLDEAHLFFNDHPDNACDTIAKEARKFGLGLVCASQSPTHFSEDFLSNVATKLILGIDEMYWDGSVRKLKIDLKTLRYIVPKRTLAAQIKTSGSTRNQFIQVDLAEPAPLAAGRASGTPDSTFRSRMTSEAR